MIHILTSLVHLGRRHNETATKFEKKNHPLFWLLHLFSDPSTFIIFAKMLSRYFIGTSCNSKSFVIQEILGRNWSMNRNPDGQKFDQQLSKIQTNSEISSMFPLQWNLQFFLSLLLLRSNRQYIIVFL